MRERMTGTQEVQRRLVHQTQLRSMFLTLFPDEEDVIKKGKFVDQIPICGDGSPVVGDIFICMTDMNRDDSPLDFYYWNIIKSVVVKKENNVFRIDTVFYREGVFIMSEQYSLQDNPVVNSELKRYFVNEQSYSSSYVKELFLYPPNTAKQQTT